MSQFKITSIEENLSNEDYHSHGTEIISSSYVKSVFKHSIAKAKAPINASQEALDFGTKFHDMMEHGIEGFDKIYTVTPEPPQEILDKYKNYKLSNEYKEWKKVNLEDVENLVSDYDRHRLIEMYKNVERNEVYRSWEDNYDIHNEYSFFGECMGLRVRVRPDRFYTFNGERSIAIDFKSCQDITQFKWDIKKYAYDIQAVFYSDFIGIDPTNFYFIASEKEFPFKCQVFSLDGEKVGYDKLTSVDRARKNLYSTIEKIKRKDYSVGNFNLIERV